MKTKFTFNYIKKHIFSIASGLILLWFVLAFLIYPNVMIAVSSFKTDDGFSFNIIKKLIESPIAVKGMRNSFILAFSMAITSNIVGIFIVLVSEYFDIKGAKILKLGYMSTFIYGGIILMSGYLMIYGQNGIITSLLTKVMPNLDPKWFFGYGAVLFIMTVSTTTYHMMFLSNAVKGIDNFTIEASRNMGASAFYTIKRVVLPIVLPTLYAITILQFLSGLSAFAAPLIVGGKDFQTITPLILQLNKLPNSRGLALILSMVLGLSTVLLLFLFSKLEKGGTYFSISKTKAAYVKQKIDNKFLNICVHIFAYVLFVIYTFPVLMIVLFSFTNSTAINNVKFTFSDFTLDNYRTVFSDVKKVEPFLNSATFAIVAAIGVVIVVLLGVSLRRKHKNGFTSLIENSFLIPWMLPSTLIALGLLTTYSVPRLIIGNKVLIGTIQILIIAYIIIRIPFTSRLMKAAYQSVDSDYEKAAKALGAKTFYTFRRIVLPLILPTVVSLIVLGFNGLLTDYNVAAFLSHPLKEPLGLMIKRYTTERAGGDSQAIIFVYSTVLMAIASTTMYLVYGKLLRQK